MPHVIVKMWPGESELQKQRLADALTKDVVEVLGYGEESVSVGIEEVSADEWFDMIFKPDIDQKQDTLYKDPGYTM